MSNIMCACGNDVEYPTCAECEDKEVAALRVKNEALTKALRFANERMKWTLTHVDVAARTGQVAQGGEQNGNRMCFEWARDYLRNAIAQAEEVLR